MLDSLSRLLAFMLRQACGLHVVGHKVKIDNRTFIKQPERVLQFKCANMRRFKAKIVEVKSFRVPKYAQHHAPLSNKSPPQIRPLLGFANQITQPCQSLVPNLSTVDHSPSRREGKHLVRKTNKLTTKYRFLT